MVVGVKSFSITIEFYHVYRGANLVLPKDIKPTSNYINKRMKFSILLPIYRRVYFFHTNTIISCVVCNIKVSILLVLEKKGNSRRNSTNRCKVIRHFVFFFFQKWNVLAFFPTKHNNLSKYANTTFYLERKSDSMFFVSSLGFFLASVNAVWCTLRSWIFRFMFRWKSLL